MRPGPLIRTFGEMPTTKGPLCWIVPRDIDPCVPAGFGFVGRALQFPLLPEGPEVCVRLDLWRPEVSAATFGMLLVSSVLMRVASAGGPAMPDIRLVSPRYPWAVRVDEGTRLALTAAQRWPGEVVAVPLRLIDEEAAARTYLGASLRRFDFPECGDVPAVDGEGGA